MDYVPQSALLQLVVSVLVTCLSSGAPVVPPAATVSRVLSTAARPAPTTSPIARWCTPDTRCRTLHCTTVHPGMQANAGSDVRLNVTFKGTNVYGICPPTNGGYRCINKSVPHLFDEIFTSGSNKTILRSGTQASYLDLIVVNMSEKASHSQWYLDKIVVDAGKYKLTTKFVFPHLNGFKTHQVKPSGILW